MLSRHLCCILLAVAKHASSPVFIHHRGAEELVKGSFWWKTAHCLAVLSASPRITHAPQIIKTFFSGCRGWPHLTAFTPFKELSMIEPHLHLNRQMILSLIVSRQLLQSFSCIFMFDLISLFENKLGKCLHLYQIEQDNMIAVIEGVQAGQSCLCFPLLSLYGHFCLFFFFLSPAESTAKISSGDRWLSPFLSRDSFHPGPLISDMSLKGSRRGHGVNGDW